MKGVVMRICRDAIIVDITHEIIPQNIEQGAFILYTTVPYFPPGTVHVAVVDPGVGTERKGLIIDCGDYVLVGPDNGLLLPAARRGKKFDVYEITNRRYFMEGVTHTFHGRDIFAPVAAHIARGVEIREIGRKIDEYVDMSLGFGKVRDGKIEGKIVHIDRFGNLITNIEGRTLLDRAEYGKVIDIEIGDLQLKIPFYKSYGYAGENELLLTIGGNGFVEIGVNMGSAFEKLKKGMGERVTLTL